MYELKMEHVKILNYVNDEENLINLKNAYGIFKFVNTTFKKN